jgi:HAD superfamily hydrolase (TIGR01509 family)
VLFSAIIFDCDGVLVNTEELGLVIELEALRRIGLDYSRDEYITRFMGLGDAELRATYAEEHIRRLGRALPVSFVSDMKAEKRRAFDEKIRTIPGVSDFLQRLNVPIAVASSSSIEQLSHKMERVGLHARFRPHIYSSQLVARPKPAPDIYLYAARKLQSKPEQCLVIEDSPNGIRAAAAAGMTVWGFLGGGHLGTAHEDLLLNAGAHKLFASYEDIQSEFVNC